MSNSRPAASGVTESTETYISDSTQTRIIIKPAGWTMSTTPLKPQSHIMSNVWSHAYCQHNLQSVRHLNMTHTCHLTHNAELASE